MGIKTNKVNVLVNSHLEQIFGETKLALSNLVSVDVGSARTRDIIVRNAR